MSGISQTPADWYPDPLGRHEVRYWDGTQWTEHVASQGEQAVDPPVGDSDLPTATRPTEKIGVDGETIRCPWCAEEVLSAARKCKHCGEFLTGEVPADRSGSTPVVASPSVAAGREHQCPTCSDLLGSPRDLYLHRVNAHNYSATQRVIEPVWRFGGLAWRCIAHDKFACTTCSKVHRLPRTSGRKGDVYPLPGSDGSTSTQPRRGPQSSVPTGSTKVVNLREGNPRRLNKAIERVASKAAMDGWSVRAVTRDRDSVMAFGSHKHQATIVLEKM